MVVLTDNVMVFCIEDKQRFGNEQNKKSHPKVTFNVIAI